ncbi:MAG: hypothetical protein JJT90_10775 [Ectothiorhodospiraceae bacterium]|nr:hypothetical protein [Ectothiorhodospiraceae bacterium]
MRTSRKHVFHAGATTTGTESPDERKDRWFQPVLAPKTEKMREAVQKVVDRLTHYEMKLGWRKRGRRPSDQKVFEITVSALICNLVYHALIAEDGQGIAYHRSHRELGKSGRYVPVAINKTLPKIVERLASSRLRFLTHELGKQQHFGFSKVSVMFPGEATLRLIRKYDLAIHDVGRSLDQETIILKRPKKGPLDEGEMIPYDDTEVTRRYREELREINSWISAADIHFDPCQTDVARRADPTDLVLRRYFTMGRFDCGGRLFGGFWQRLHKYERRHRIEIEGEGVVSLDYSQMAPRMLYGEVGVVPAQEDAYQVPGFERHREGVKRLFNAMLFASQPMTRMPKGLADKFPKGTRVSDVAKAIQAAHKPISAHFFTGVGHHLQFKESEILIEILRRLRGLGHVALPVHDAVVVKASIAETAKQVMEEVFLRHTGLPGIVTEE